MTTLRTEPVQRGLEALARSGLGWREFVRGTIDLLGTAIPHDAACVGPVDPGTGLLTGSEKSNIGDELDAEFLEHEYVTDDVNLFRSLARREHPVGILADDTGGDPRRSSRHRDMFVPHWSLDHELRAAALSQGRPWAAVALYRNGESSGFSPAEADFLARMTSTIALGVRAGLVSDVAVRTSVAVPGVPEGPAVLVVDAGNTVVRLSPAAEHRVAELGGSAWDALPTPVAAVVSAARALAEGRRDVVPRLRVRTRAGQWLVVHAAPLAGPTGGASVGASGGTAGGAAGRAPGGGARGAAHQVVVTIEEARPAEVVPLVIAAFGLTGRERDVVAGVLHGDSTQQIGRSLHLSPYTVQDHLKAVFDKAGVGSRRELVARVHADHYAPRSDLDLGPSGWYVA